MGVLTDSSLISELAVLLGIPRGRAAETLELTLQLLRESLLRNHQIDLDDFVSLHVVEEKARLVPVADSDARVIEGARNRVLSAPLGSFEQDLARVRLAPIILVCPRNDLFAQVIVHHFTQEGWHVRLIHETREAATALDGESTCLVILDFNLPNAQDLLDRIKRQRHTNAIPVVAFFPRQHDPGHPTRLRIRADQEVAEPFEVLELLSLAGRELARSAEERLLFDQQLELILPSTQADLDRVARLASDLLADSGLDPHSQSTFSTALREAVGNAIQHGNQRDPDKAVHVQYLHNPDRITVVVRDEGDGFDPAPYLEQAARADAVAAARARHQQGGQGGLGILMIRRSTDSVEYNATGDTVTLTKHLRTPQPAPEHTAAEIPLSPIEQHPIDFLDGEQEIDLSQEIREQSQEGAENLPTSDIMDGEEDPQENPDP